MTDSVELPEGQDSFTLSDVCKLANVQPYMLRFWSTEFAELEAQKSSTGQRLYSRAQVEVVLEIRRLLFDEGMTIAGARKRITAKSEGDEEQEPAPEAVPTKRKSTVRQAQKAGEKSEPATSPEVDKKAPERVQPLLATLKTVREEVSKIVADLQKEAKT
jgi:DNA-binding transcriptional MerR regulator